MKKAMIPSFVTREAFLPALAIPLVRKIVSAFARSPSASASARLQSIIPALVFSRSCLASFGSISAITLIEFEFDGRRSRSLGGNAGHLDLFANTGFAACRDNRIDQFLEHDPDGANSIVISGNRIIDHVRIGVGINDRNDWNVQAFCFIDRVLFARRV